MRTKRLLTMFLVLCMVLSCISPATAISPERLTIEDAYDSISTGNQTSNQQTPLNRVEATDDAAVGVTTGSAAMSKNEIGDVSADVSYQKTDSLMSVSSSGSGSWLIEQLTDVSLDLTDTNSCVEELQELTSVYEAEERLTAFVILEDEPLAAAYSSQAMVPDSVMESLASKQELVISSIENAVGSVDVVCQFKFLTNAVVVETEFENLTAIAQLDGVASVFVSPVFYAADSSDAEMMTVSSGQMTNVDAVWNLNHTGYTGAGMTIAILDTGLDLDHPSFEADPEMNENSWTEAYVQSMLDEYGDALNAVSSFTGSTLTAKNVYYSAKIPFRFNYAMGTNNVLHNDSIGDHGTHVSGIAAANAVEGTGVVGMAPDAQIIAMKVFNSTTGGATLYDFIAALEDCITMGVDVANLSLGSYAGFSESGYAELDAIFERIDGSGLIVNIAAGNDGTSAAGSLYGESKALTASIDNAAVSSPSTYANVMSIASVDNAYVMADYFALADGTDVFYQSAMEYLYGYTSVGLQEYYGEDTLEYVIVDGLGYEEDFYGEDGESLVEGKVAVIKRGTLNFGIKTSNAEAAGAVAAIIWNQSGDDVFSYGMSVGLVDADGNSTGEYPGIPAVLIGQTAGQTMADAETKTLTVALDSKYRINVGGGQVSSFSSWGVSADLRLLPELAGIGGNVYSCYDDGQYGIMSGTSMATPQVAGVTALVKQYLKENDLVDDDEIGEVTKALMMSTANPIIDDVSELETSPRQQGAGLVDALKAVTSGAYLTVDGGLPKGELGDNENGIYSFTIELHNLSNASQTYTLDASLLTEDYVESAYYDGVTYMAGYDTELDGKVEFSNHTVTVDAGSTARVQVTITLSDAGKNWINQHFENGNYVEGYIYFHNQAEDGVDLSLPFLGFYQNWSDAPIFDSGYWYDNGFWAYNGMSVNNEITAEEFWLVPWTNMGYSDNDWMLGLNPYAGVLIDENGDVLYSADNNVLAPDGDGVMDKLSDYYLALLRNARYVWLTYTDDNGNVLDRQTIEYESKTMYSGNYGYTIPSVYSWYYTTDALYDFTDANGQYLADGTTVTLTISAVIDYDLDSKITVDADGNVIPVKVDDYIEIPITMDLTAPVLNKVEEISEEDGSKYLVVTFTEEHPATVVLMNPTGTQLYKQVYDNDSSLVKNEDGTWSIVLDITGHGDDFAIAIGDYAFNEAYFKVSREENGGNDPAMDTAALYAYQVYNLPIYYSYGWDYMFGWCNVDKGLVNTDNDVVMLNSDVYEYYAINAAEYVDGYIFAVDAGCNFLYMKPGIWSRTTICNIGYEVVDMAFDDVTGTMWLVICDSTANYYGLATLNLLTGEVTLVRNYYSQYYMPWAITFVDGAMYGCRYYYSGFCSVDLDNNCNLSWVYNEAGSKLEPKLSNGSTAYPLYAQSMTYSQEDKLIYWLFYDGSAAELIVIDPATWTSQPKNLGYTEYVGALTLEETDYEIPVSTEVTKLVMGEDTVVLSVGSTYELTAYALPWNAPADHIAWSSGDSSVATVDENGVVTAVGQGKVTITASCDKGLATCEVTVIEINGSLHGYDYSADGVYGYWQTIDLATMATTNDYYSEVEFIAADYNGHDGYIYGFNIDSNNKTQSLKMNAETGEVTMLLGSGQVNDMAYDYTTGIMYAVMSGSTDLYAMNMHSGKLVKVASCPGQYSDFMTLACDLEGNLYTIDVTGKLYKLSVVEDDGSSGGGGGIIIFSALYEALNDENDVLINDSYGYTGSDTDIQLTVKKEQIMTVDVSTYGSLVYGQSMCYDFTNDVILWCYTDGSTFRWVDVEDKYVYDLGSVKSHSVPQYLGLYVAPREEDIPELEPVPVSSIEADDMFMLVGATKTPVIDLDPVNVNQDYVISYDITAITNDDGAADAVIEIDENGDFTALKAGTVALDVSVCDAEGTELAATSFKVTVKNATGSDIRLFMDSNYYWVGVDQYNTASSNLYPYGSVVYGGQTYYMYAAEYVAADDLIYGYGYVPGTGTRYFEFMTFNPETMSISGMIDMDHEFPFVYDLAYDYTSGTMYALAGNSSVVALYYVDMETGELIKACNLDIKFLNMTVDADGVVYLMTQNDAQLYTVDPQNGKLELVLNTGVNSPYMASLAYDYDTGYLYWTAYEGLYLIDLKDSTVSLVGSLVSQNQALMLIGDVYPEVPDALMNVDMTAELVELQVGETEKLEVFSKPSFVDTTVSWYSSDETVATVDENGVVSAVGSGTATITVVVTDGTNDIICYCTVIVYGESDYFISYNVTDKGFSVIDRLDTTKVTNLTENEEAASVNTMVMVDDVIYAYDEEGNFFSTTEADGFTRTYLGSHGIDVSHLSYTEEDASQSSTYVARFDVRGMAVYGDQVLVIGRIGYDVTTTYNYGWYTYTTNYYASAGNGSRLYEADLETGELTELCTILTQDGTPMQAAAAIAVDSQGRIYVYNSYNDFISRLDLETGMTTYVTGMQSLGVYSGGTIGMTYDEVTNNLYLLFTSNNKYYRMYKIDVDTASINYIGDVDEVVSSNGDLFNGLMLKSSVVLPEHTHDYEKVYQAPTCTEDGHYGYVCDCGDELFMTTVPATGHEYGGDGFCVHCGKKKPGSETPVRPVVPSKPSNGSSSESSENVNIVVNFSDVNVGDWHYNYVMDLANSGVINGYPDGTFRPQGNVTWGEALKLTAKALGYGDMDCNDNHWASGYLLWAKTNGFVSVDANIDLDTAITRGEMSDLLANAMQLEFGKQISCPFEDKAPESAIALYAAGIITGSLDDGHLLFRAESTITRAEMAAIIWRVYNN